MNERLKRVLIETEDGELILIKNGDVLDLAYVADIKETTAKTKIKKYFNKSSHLSQKQIDNKMNELICSCNKTK